MKRVLIITGLGADQSAFENISFPENWQITFYTWSYQTGNLTLSEYVKRLKKHLSNDFQMIIGLSFGSIVAQELALLYSIPPIIITISGIRSAKQLSLFKLVLPLIKIVPTKLFEIPNPALWWLFSINNSKSRNVLSKIVRRSNGSFVKWCLVELGKWTEKDTKGQIISIHGKRDRLVKPPLMPGIILINGGHFAVHQQSDEISEILNEIEKY